MQYPTRDEDEVDHGPWLMMDRCVCGRGRRQRVLIDDTGRGRSCHPGLEPELRLVGVNRPLQHRLSVWLNYKSVMILVLFREC